MSSSGVFLFVVSVLISTAFAVEGPNVCQKEEEVPVEVQVSYHIPYQVKTFGWCLKVPPRCAKTRTAFKVGYKTETKLSRRTVERCCDGFAQTGNRCIPICSNNCYHGKCAAPETCECLAGYSGATCNISCPANTWGPKCDNQCQCGHGSKCDPATGECSCKPGWQGDSCKEPCAATHYGFMCIQECRCMNGATCDHVSGKCTCAPGYQGAYCEEKCPEGSHGPECSNKCRCQNGAACHHVNGVCDCAVGWTGEVCANECPDGTYGKDCLRTCNCEHGAVCDKDDGACKCPAGFRGVICSIECSPGTFGVNCKGRCDCANNSTCSTVDGKCSCAPGFEGVRCDAQILASGVRSGRQADDESFATGGIIGFVSLAVILIVIMLLLFIKFRHHSGLFRKDEDVSYVTYVADRPPNTDQSIYSPPPGLSAQANNSKFILKTVNNDLSQAMIRNNVQKANAKLAAFEAEEEERGAVGGCNPNYAHDLKVKSFADDATIEPKRMNISVNPVPTDMNIYTSWSSVDKVEDKDNVYEEVKPRKGEEDDDGYSRLTYPSEPPPSYDNTMAADARPSSSRPTPSSRLLNSSVSRGPVTVTPDGVYEVPSSASAISSDYNYSQFSSDSNSYEQIGGSDKKNGSEK